MTIHQYSTKERVMQHEMFDKDFVTTAIKLLENYYGDIDYMADCSLDTCNAMTNGTPYFDNDQQMHDYLKFLKAFILVFKEENES
jgi:hypothetical protein